MFIQTKSLKQILCIKWGTRYTPLYVNNLYGGVSRNITGSFKFYCMTDNPEGIRPEVECLPLPELGFEVPTNLPGKWPKQALWGKELFGLEGVVLFIDLDSVIVGNMDHYFEIGHEDDVYTARNWIKPWKRGAQTSVFRFKVGAHPYMLEDLRKDPQLCAKYRMEQNYVTHHINGGVKFWPEKWTKHFRRHCMGPWFMRYFRAPKLPKDAIIITFPGKPDPPDAIIGKWHGWGIEGKTLTPWEHIKWALSAPSLILKEKRLHRFFLPCKWLADYWRP